MQKIEIGEWEFNVDTEATQNYYKDYAVLELDTQCNRNYQEYCKQLSEPEQRFFDAFGINPKRCNVTTAGLTNEKTYPTFGVYYFAGEFIKKPKEQIMTAEEFAENNFNHDSPDPRVYIGKYQFEFVDPESVFGRIPDDMPDGFICIRFYSDMMPWLLSEKCKERMYYPPKPWQLIKKLRLRFKHLRNNKNHLIKLMSSLILMFERHKISYREMRKSEIKSYMNRWFIEIVPIHNQEKARNNCFSTGKYTCYLWHAFSYGDAACADGESAIVAFNSCKKDKSVLIMNYEKIGFVLDSTDGITAEELNEFNDVIITHENFEWSYVHTHEGNCGPYFYQNNKTFLNLNEQAQERIWADDKSCYCEIVGSIRGDYMAMFYIKDHDNYSNTYYRYYHLEKRIMKNSKEEIILEAKKLLEEIAQKG